jgi:hypothetical protein
MLVLANWSNSLPDIWYANKDIQLLITAVLNSDFSTCLVGEVRRATGTEFRFAYIPTIPHKIITIKDKTKYMQS